MTSSKKRGLGKGLSALFGDQDIQSKDNEKIQNFKTQLKIPISDLNRNEYQPRLKFDDDKLNQLSLSIKQNGIIQPIAVRKDKKNSGKYEIIAGERRWLAAQKAGLHEVPVVILDLDDNETLEVAIVENIQREDLNIVEEAKGYERLNKEFGYDHDKIAKLMSKSRSHISNTLRLLSLPKDVVSMLEEGTLTAGQARPLVGLPSASNIAEEIVSKNYSARKIENLVKQKKNTLKLNTPIDSNVLKVQDELESVLGLKILISNRKNNSGKLTIEYKNLEQFEMISKLLKS